ncbi:thioredoxin-disulfide reductase [Clostridium hydrogenum]|uniref:thioredoxin-disulfide reductase n=1 Tax=Clostridium hydrogenum TaxID=2855764 RepID=UPI001F2A72DE|nr:thioredoxin-disulfide reductase [Clostridium hydrogenum]
MREDYDLIIIGSGPAGLAAAIYGGRAKLKTLVLEKSEVGGRAHTTREIVNYPGISNITGPGLSEKMEAHAQKFGVEIRRQNVKLVNLKGNDKIVISKKGEYHAPAVIIASGTSARILDIPGEKEYTGMGVSYCATCDAEFFQDQEVVVVGSGDQGIEEGMFIAKYASKVTVVVLHDEGILDCNKQAAQKAFAHPKMNFIWNSVVTEIKGDGNEVTSVRINNEKTKEAYDFYCNGIFFFVGMVPVTDFLKDQINLDDRGWIHTNEMMETDISGVYAVGDVRAKYLRQVVTAVSDGAIAASAAERYIEEQKDFRHDVMESDIPVFLGFWSPEIEGSLDRMNSMRTERETTEQSSKFIEIDISRKKSIASFYAVELTKAQPSVIIKVEHGKVVNR